MEKSFHPFRNGKIHISKERGKYGKAKHWLKKNHHLLNRNP